MTSWRARLGLAAFCLALAVASLQAGPASAEEGCPLGPAKTVDGQRRLALLIGVGKYLGPGLAQLDGPVNDVRKFHALLSGSQGYGFPEENICVLTDEHATQAGVENALQKVLLDRVGGKADEVVIYFAGHGSQAEDTNGDEADGMDETLVLNDSRTEGRGDFLDDHLNRWLKRLDEKTPNITLILDSCNSGTASRGEFKVRYARPAARGTAPGATRVARGDETDLTPASLAGLTVLSAASDGTSAMERDGAGLFTQALVEILSASPRLTYAQLERRIPPLLRAAGTPQIAYVQGDLEDFVFQNGSRAAPVSWTVRSVSPGSGSSPTRIEIAGPPLPGMGRNAELRLFDGALEGNDFLDPAKSKGLAVVDAITGLNASATVAQAPDRSAPAEGDIALIARPSDDYEPFMVSLKPAGQPDGVPSALAAFLRDAIQSNQGANGLVTLSDAGDLEVSAGKDGSLVLRGAANEVRNVLPPSTPKKQADTLTRILILHARQRVFLRLKGEGGNDFTDGETLKVQIVPETRQSPCAAGTWVQAPANSEQIIPECFETHVQVTVDPDSPFPLLVGGLILSSDGSIIGFPSGNQAEEIAAGSTFAFRGPYERQIAISPYEVQDHILVFGTQKQNKVNWSELSQVARGTSDGSAGTLHRMLDRYLGGKRGSISSVDGDDTTWTMTSVATRVLQRPGSPGGKEACRARLCEAANQ